MDCGIAQGHDPQVPFDRFLVPPADIDFLFLTHAHIDHIGRVPDLIDVGFCGEIICTHGTKTLLLPMLRDAMSFFHRTDPQVRAIVEDRTTAKTVIRRLSGYSAHADQKTLCDWVKFMPEPPGEIRLVHGEFVSSVPFNG